MYISSMVRILYYMTDMIYDDTVITMFDLTILSIQNCHPWWSNIFLVGNSIELFSA